MSVVLLPMVAAFTIPALRDTTNDEYYDLVVFRSAGFAEMATVVPSCAPLLVPSAIC